MEITQLKAAVHSLDSHKAEDLTALQVTSLTSIADVFLLASGSSATQVRSLADYLEEELGRQGIHPLRSDGYDAGDWISLDYGDMLVHLFRQETRAFYDLEHLWADAHRMDIRPYLVQPEQSQEQD